MAKMKSKVRKRLREGCVIPAHPLALDRNRRLDERRQRALTRYYLSAGAGGVAVGVHTTQFEIRDAGLLRPVLELAAETSSEFEGKGRAGIVRVAGVCGETEQAVSEAALAAELGYHAGLLNLGALKTASVEQLVEHVRAVARAIPVFGFYLQPAVGGRPLPYELWRQMAEIEGVVAIKIAAFNRYQTIDVVRAVAESGRLGDIALYTGNDDTILTDLVNVYRFKEEKKKREARFVGGLLGHWAVWTRRAVEHLAEAHRVVKQRLPIPIPYLRLSNQVTDANAAFFDPANDFAGCIAGIHEVLRRQRLLEGTWCLNPNEGLSAGQAEEIDRVYAAYPHLNDDPFVEQHLDEWMR